MDAVPPEVWCPPAEVRQLDTREELRWKKDIYHHEPEHGPGPGADLVGAAILRATATAHLEDSALV